MDTPYGSAHAPAYGYGKKHANNPPKRDERAVLGSLLEDGWTSPSGQVHSGALPGDAVLTLPSGEAKCASLFSKILARKFGPDLGGCRIRGFETSLEMLGQARAKGVAGLEMIHGDIVDHLNRSSSISHVALAWLDFIGEPDAKKLLAAVNFAARGTFMREGRTTFLALTFKNFQQRKLWIDEAMDATAASCGALADAGGRVERLAAWIAALIREAGRGGLSVEIARCNSYPSPINKRLMHSIVLAVVQLPGFEPARVAQPSPFALGWIGSAALPRRADGPFTFLEKARRVRAAGHEVLGFLPPDDVGAESPRLDRDARKSAAPARSATDDLSWRDLVGLGVPGFRPLDLTERQDGQARASYAAKRRKGLLDDVPFDEWLSSMVGRRAKASA